MSLRRTDTEISPQAPPDPQGKGLRTDSVGLLAVVALGLSSVAPAYSIAVTLGFVVGRRAPGSGRSAGRFRADPADGLCLS